MRTNKIADPFMKRVSSIQYETVPAHQIDSVTKYMIEISCQRGNYNNGTKNKFHSEYHLCRLWLNEKHKNKKIREAEEKLKQEINHHREQERLDIALSFIGY